MPFTAATFAIAKQAFVEHGCSVNIPAKDQQVKVQGVMGFNCWWATGRTVSVDFFPHGVTAQDFVNGVTVQLPGQLSKFLAANLVVVYDPADAGNVIQVAEALNA